MKKFYLLLLFIGMMLAHVPASAQRQAIRGTIVDQQGQPVVGAAVTIRGTTIGTTSGADGELYLAATPSPEVDALRADAAVRKSFSAGSRGTTLALPESCRGLCEIDLRLLPSAGCNSVELTLANGLGEEVAVRCDFGGGELSMDRRRSGITGFSKDFPAVTVAPLPAGDSFALRLYVDRASLELFEETGRLAMTNLLFPNEPYDRLTLRTDRGRCRIEGLTVYPMNR